MSLSMASARERCFERALAPEAHRRPSSALSLLADLDAARA